MKIEKLAETKLKINAVHLPKIKLPAIVTKIDGICTRKTYAFLQKFFIKLRRGKQPFYGSLTIVKIALYGANRHIAALLGDHLGTLNSGNAAVGIEYADLHARHIGKTCQQIFKHSDALLYAKILPAGRKISNPTSTRPQVNLVSALISNFINNPPWTVRWRK